MGPRPPNPSAQSTGNGRDVEEVEASIGPPRGFQTVSRTLRYSE